MKLGPDLAIRILAEVGALTTEEVIIIDQTGIIIASVEKSRVGSRHEGAIMVIESKQTLYISSLLAKELAGVKPGINLPIFFKEQVIGVIGITGIPESVEPFAKMIRKMTELIITEAHYIEKQEWETRMLETFFYEWVYTDVVGDAFIERGEILGISFSHRYRCILIEVNLKLSSEELLTVHSMMDNWFKKIFIKGENDYLIRWGRNRFLLIKSDDNEEAQSKLEYELIKCQQYFQDQLNVSVWMGVARTSEKYRLSKSYEEANKALKVAERNQMIIYYDSLLIDLVLEDITPEMQHEFIKRVLSNIEKDEELLSTLRIYLANNQSLKQSAEELHIHINTLHYRLNLICKLTKIDPKSSEGIALFYLGLILLDKNTNLAL